MVETINREQNEIIDTVANFLLVNSEVINKNGLEGKVPLIYFLFTYGESFSKEHYTNFAFEILEDLLIEVISKIEKHIPEANSNIAGLGWSLMKFIECDCFESDDLQDILKLIDSAVLLDLDVLIKKDVNIYSINDLIIHGHYLLERKSMLQKNKDLLAILNKSFNDVLLKLDKYCSLIDNIDYLNQALYLELIGYEMNDCKNFQFTRYIQKHNIHENKQITFSSTITNLTNEVGLVFNELYFKDIDEFEINKAVLITEIESNVNALIHTLLKKEKDNNHQLFSKLIIQAIFLCKENRLKGDKFFLAGLFSNLKENKL